MIETEKLQKAVELTVAAGYQLNKDAFEFLSIVAATEDPTEIINRAIQKMKTLKEDPLFIDRRFLEKLVKTMKPVKEVPTRSLEEPFQTLP
jgi:hypothetical protein